MIAYIDLIKLISNLQILQHSRLMQIRQLRHVIDPAGRSLHISRIYSWQVCNNLRKYQKQNVINLRIFYWNKQDFIHLRTFFPLLAWISTSCPLIFDTFPSIHAMSRSSTQTCEPTIMFTGVPCTRSKSNNEFCSECIIILLSIVRHIQRLKTQNLTIFERRLY